MKKIGLRTALLVLGSLVAVARVGYAQVLPPTIEKAFGASSIPLDGTTTLTFTITNPNSAVTLTGIGMSDTLPAGLVTTVPCGLSGTCNGAFSTVCGSSSMSLTGASLAPNASCSVTVTSIMGATVGDKNNVTSAVTSTEGGSGNSAMASIAVGVLPPTIEKAFGASSIPLDGTTTLTFTITNPNSGVTLTGIGMSDTLPAGLVTTVPCGLSGTCSGAFSTVCGSSSMSLTGASLAPNASCSVTVTSIMGATVGDKNNVTSAVTSTEGGSGNSAMASIAVGATATPTSTPTTTPSNTPTNTPTSVPPTATQTLGPGVPPPAVPTLSFPMLALMALVLAATAVFLVKRP